MRDLTRQSAAVVLLAIVVASGILAYVIYKDEERNAPEPDLIPISRELSALVAQNLSGSAGRPDSEIIANITELVPYWASASSVGVEGYTVHVFDVSASIVRNSRPLQITSPLIKAGISQRINSMLYRTPSETISVPGIRAEIVASVRLEPIEKGEKVFTEITIEPEVVDAPAAAERIIDCLSADVVGPGSEIGRDVEYMLNTLARVRAANKYGFLNKAGPSNVLNQGDIELAINLALCMRIASATGKVPQVLADSIDRYFTHQNPVMGMNPTGFRQWGVSEYGNFNAYSSMAGPKDQRRDAVSLVSTAIERGKADPADVMARLLYLERNYGGAQASPTFNPFDEKGALEEAKLVNARQDFDLNDPNSLKTIVSFQPEEGLRVVSPDRSSEGSVLVPRLDVPNGYLVSAREYKVKGLAPSEWYTMVDLNRSAESLVNINFTAGRGTRCGGIVPPSKPPDHDFRMEWNLMIEGSFSVRSSAQMWEGNYPSEGSASRTIHFSFPARVVSWYENRPFNDNHLFKKEYEIEVVNTTYASGYIIPAEANATEFFEEYFFPSLRGMVSPLSALQRLIGSYGNITPQDLSAREAVQLASRQALLDVMAWSENLTDAERDHLIKFMPAYLKKGALVPFIKPIRIDGLKVEFEWSGFSDRLDIMISSTGGSITVSIQGLLSPPVTLSASVDPGNVRIDLDFTDQDFKATYETPKGQFREGPGSPNKPADGLTELALSSSWEASSPQYNLSEGPMNGYPYEPLTSDGSDARVTYSVLVRGGEDDDGGDSLRVLQELMGSSETSFTMLIPFVLCSDGTWTGVRVREETEGTVIVRTLWIKPDGSESGILANDIWTRDLFVSILPGGADPGIPPEISRTQIAIETNYRSGSDSITFYRDLTAEHPSLYAFRGNVPEVPAEWEIVELSPPSPLW